MTALDWRGQAGSGRLGADSVTGHIDDFARWMRDLAAFWREWARAGNGPHVLAGHSMGGHLALRAVAEQQAAPDALVLSAPMLGFLPPWLPPALQRAWADIMCRTGDARRPAWKWSEKPGETPPNRVELLTHDAARYADEQWWRAARPELAMGPGSWGWVAAALRSMAVLDRPGKLEAVEIPVFILAASYDRLVSFPATKRAAARLPHAELVVLEGAGHFVMEDEPERVGAEIAGFLSGLRP